MPGRCRTRYADREGCYRHDPVVRAEDTGTEPVKPVGQPAPMGLICVVVGGVVIPGVKHSAQVGASKDWFAFLASSWLAWGRGGR